MRQGTSETDLHDNAEATCDLPTVVDDGQSANPLASFIPKDAWIAYHGTSSAYAQSIESAGLTPSASPWTIEDARAVCAVYDRMEWAGPPSRGLGAPYPALRVWTLDHDIERTGQRHLYFAECFARATTYAGMVGGETVRALISCLEDLLRLEQEPELRNDQVVRLVRQLRPLGYELDSEYRLLRALHGTHPSADAHVDAIARVRNIEWIRAQNETFAPLLERLRRVKADHEGIVYAVRLTPELLVGAGYSNMGIEVHRSIPASHLVAKATSTVARAREHMTVCPPEDIQAWTERAGQLFEGSDL